MPGEGVGHPLLGKARGEVGYPYLGSFLSQDLFCFKLDAKSVPEALATTILILLMFSIVLAHQREPRSMAPPHPSGTPHRHPWAPPRHPW